MAKLQSKDFPVVPRSAVRQSACPAGSPFSGDGRLVRGSPDCAGSPFSCDNSLNSGSPQELLSAAPYILPRPHLQLSPGYRCPERKAESCSPGNRHHPYKKLFPASSPSECDSYYHPSAYPPPLLPPPPGLSGNPSLAFADSAYSPDVGGQRQACMFAGAETRLEELDGPSWSYSCPLPSAMTPVDPYPSYPPHPHYSSSPQGSRVSAVAHQSSPPQPDHTTHDSYQSQSAGPTSQSSQSMRGRQLSPPPREYPRYTPNPSPPLYHTLETNTHVRCAVPEWSAAS